MIHGPDGSLHLNQEGRELVFLHCKLPAGIGNDSVLLFVVTLGEDGSKASWLAVIS